MTNFNKLFFTMGYKSPTVLRCEKSHRLLHNPMSSNFNIKKEKESFIKALPGVIANLSKHPKFQEISVAREWMEKVVNGNVLGGKNTRGLTTVLAYKMIEKAENLTEENVRLAHTLGWCAEILQGYCTVLDDISDGSVKRRGQLCWFRREDVGLSVAVNDSILLTCVLMQILRDNFKKAPRYIDMIHAFNENLFFTWFGQYLDIIYGQTRKYEQFTNKNYDTLVQHKTGYYTFKLPITLGFLLANIQNPDTYKNVEEISLLLARLFQMQDDFIDCYGDIKLTGKEGTDIQEGKCSWLAVNALCLCTPPQRKVFVACYGSPEPAHIERVKQLYLQLKLPELYKTEENNLYNKIIHKIQTLSSRGEQEVFSSVLDITYKRKF